LPFSIADRGNIGNHQRPAIRSGKFHNGKPGEQHSSTASALPYKPGFQRSRVLITSRLLDILYAALISLFIF